MGSAIDVHVEHIQDGLKELPPFYIVLFTIFLKQKGTTAERRLKLVTLSVSLSPFMFSCLLSPIF